MIAGGEHTEPEAQGTDTNSPNIQEDVNSVTDKIAGAVKNPEENVLNNVSYFENLNNILSLESVIQQLISFSYKQESIAKTEDPTAEEIAQNTQDATTDDPTVPVKQNNVIAEGEHSEPEEEVLGDISKTENLDTIANFEAVYAASKQHLL